MSDTDSPPRLATRLADRQCISFTVSGDWGHFRRPDTTDAKQTFRVIPRTALAGLVAAILGLPRDSYYDLFDAASSAVAIQPVNPPSPMPLPMTGLDTEGEKLTSDLPLPGKAVSKEQMESNRQRYIYEMLRNPAYRVDIALDDAHADTFDDLERHLSQGTSHYTPYLGTSECLASIEYHSTYTIDDHDANGDTHISSTVPLDDASPVLDAEYAVERTPAFFTMTDAGRQPSRFLSYAYAPTGLDIPISESPPTAYTVDDRTVCFL